MTRQVMLKLPLLESSVKSTMRLRNSPVRTTQMCKEKTKMGEVAGGAAAGCVAVSCCCPCAVVNLVVLAVYKVPAAVCKKAWRRKQRRFSRKRHGLLAATEEEEEDPYTTIHVQLNEEEDSMAEIVFDEYQESGEINEVIMLEKEMLDRFYGAGFWRSPSQRDTL